MPPPRSKLGERLVGGGRPLTLERRPSPGAREKSKDIRPDPGAIGGREWLPGDAATAGAPVKRCCGDMLAPVCDGRRRHSSEAKLLLESHTPFCTAPHAFLTALPHMVPVRRILGCGRARAITRQQPEAQCHYKLTGTGECRTCRSWNWSTRLAMPGDDRAALLLERCVSGCGLPRGGVPRGGLTPPCRAMRGL